LFFKPQNSPEFSSWRISRIPQNCEILRNFPELPGIPWHLRNSSKLCRG
jgi:hypothetical protein